MRTKTRCRLKDDRQSKYLLTIGEVMVSSRCGFWILVFGLWSLAFGLWAVVVGTWVLPLGPVKTRVCRCTSLVLSWCDFGDRFRFSHLDDLRNHTNLHKTRRCRIRTCLPFSKDQRSKYKDQSPKTKDLSCIIPMYQSRSSIPDRLYLFATRNLSQCRINLNTSSRRCRHIYCSESIDPNFISD